MVLKALPDGDHNSKTGLVAKNSGFSLHAGVATKAHERDNLEKICRYIARPAVEEERLSINAIGDVIYKFKKTATCEAVQLRMWPLGQRHDRNQAYTDGTDGAACCLSAPPEGALNPISRSSWAPLKIPKRHRTEEKNRANSSGSRTRNRCEWRCRTEASTSQKKNFLGQAS